MVAASRKRKSQGRPSNSRSRTTKRVCFDDNPTIHDFENVEISSGVDGAPSCGCSSSASADPDTDLADITSISTGIQQPPSTAGASAATALPPFSQSDSIGAACETNSLASRIEGEVRDSYQFNMKQIQNVFQRKVDQLEVKLTESERQREQLLGLIDEKDKQIDELTSAIEEVKDIRRVVYPAHTNKPARMCLCGSYTTSLDDLPEALLLGILAFLDAFSLQRVRRVSRHFKEIHRHPGLNKSVYFYVDVLQHSARYHSHRSANFLHDLYRHCLTEHTQHIIFDAGRERMELWDAFNVEDNDLCGSILPVSPHLQRLTFKSCPLGFNHLLTLPANIQRVHLLSVDLTEKAGFLSIEQYINNFEVGIRIEEAVVDLSDSNADREEMLLKLMNHHMPRLKKTDKLEIESGIGKVNEMKRNQIIQLINRREPSLKNKLDANIRRLTVNHLKSLRPWTKLGILQIIRGVTVPPTTPSGGRPGLSPSTNASTFEHRAVSKPCLKQNTRSESTIGVGVGNGDNNVG